MALHLQSGGISFEAHGGSSVNLLDDYEEGTFTPTFHGSSGGTGSLTTHSARYTKIGRQVFWNMDISVTSVSGCSGNAVIGGFPITTSTGYASGGYPIWHTQVDYDGNSMGWLLEPSNTVFAMINLKDDAASSNATVGQFDGSGGEPRMMTMGQALAA